jgi:4-amino-4-deoxy-L-arabinose transferase-like glycosyltransferase
LSKIRPWVVVTLIIVATALLRIHLIQAPLERDEGEYAYAGQLMLQGIPPYSLAANMKLPGTYAAYALVMAAFGQTIAAIHLGLLLVNAGAILLIYLLGKRLFGASCGVAASACYALMSVGAGVMGTQAHATHFVVLPAIAGALLLLRHHDSGRLATVWWAGLCFGMAFLAKQHGIVFGVFGGLWLAATGWRQWRKLPAQLLLFGAGVGLPFAVTCLLLWRAGVFEKFWFWTFRYASQYTVENSLSDGLDSFKDTVVPILQENPGLWLLAAAGLALAWWRKRDRTSAAFTTALLFFSFLGMCPGLFFREHYFVLVLPAVALLAGAAVRGRLSAGLLALALGLSLFLQGRFLFRMTPVEICRELYGVSPFPEAMRVADYIRANTKSTDRIAVLGSEPEIYFYSHRHSATSYIYTYGLMEAQPFALQMQNEMIHDIETAQPLYIVREVAEEAWLRTPESPARIFDWWEAYRPQHYQLVGVAETVSEDHTEYRWGAADAGAYVPLSDYVLTVYRRK